MTKAYLLLPFDSMPKLSVNVNKVATLRNARGGKVPDVVKVALDCERFGAQGITVHPRPDGRHIRYEDVRALSPVIKTEFNIEGYPDEAFLRLVEEVKPAQVTLVPDGPDVLTSNAGWQTVEQKDFLTPIVTRIQAFGARVSLFVDPDPKMVEGAAKVGADRVELYTERYAEGYLQNRELAVGPYVIAADAAERFGLGLNAGHDLNLDNLHFLKVKLGNLLEVSIGHALIADALYYGLENTIQLYLRELE